ncbi:MAG: hypothetical protein AB7S78_00765 [Candidatus Omnitrophota bacterium]
MVQNLIVFMMIGLSAAYLAKKMSTAVRKKKSGACSGCGKE